MNPEKEQRSQKSRKKKLGTLLSNLTINTQAPRYFEKKKDFPTPFTASPVQKKNTQNDTTTHKTQLIFFAISIFFLICAEVNYMIFSSPIAGDLFMVIASMTMIMVIISVMNQAQRPQNQSFLKTNYIKPQYNNTGFSTLNQDTKKEGKTKGTDKKQELRKAIEKKIRNKEGGAFQSPQMKASREPDVKIQELEI